MLVSIVANGKVPLHGGQARVGMDQVHDWTSRVESVDEKGAQICGAPEGLVARVYREVANVVDVCLGNVVGYRAFTKICGYHRPQERGEGLVEKSVDL